MPEPIHSLWFDLAVGAFAGAILGYGVGCLDQWYMGVDEGLRLMGTAFGVLIGLGVGYLHDRKGS